MSLGVSKTSSLSPLEIRNSLSLGIGRRKLIKLRVRQCLDTASYKEKRIEEKYLG